MNQKLKNRSKLSNDSYDIDENKSLNDIKFEKNKIKNNSTNFCLKLIKFLTVFILITIGFSYITTETFTFGHKIPNWRKYIPRKERVFTVEELSKYDGTNPDLPIYLAILGKVYDVTAGRQYYNAIDGSYGFFSGKDATRSYITGCFKTHLTHDLRGLTPGEIKNLNQWVDMYSKSDKYFYVGTVILPEIDPNSPIPAPC
ncbi:hypothetical protein HDU92_004217 [Lobulomyces angularis]|nr:hypothetical protein HDU92_004217 [Lobulomyces angularis]